jgi:hypothetical protein
MMRRKRGAGLAVVRRMPGGMMRCLRVCNRVLACSRGMGWPMLTGRTVGCGTRVPGLCGRVLCRVAGGRLGRSSRMLSRRHAGLAGLRVMSDGRLRWLRDRRRVRCRLHAGGQRRVPEIRTVMRGRSRLMRLRTRQLGCMRRVHRGGASLACIRRMNRQRQVY